MNRPVIILVHPQLAENIGMTARAMLNCGLYNLRLVNPKENHLSEKAISAASGADIILKNAQVFSSIREAINDLEQVFATTARHRDMIKPKYTPTQAIKEIKGKSGILFGCERTGLENDDISLASATIEIPLNKEHTSLNLSQAVLIIGYEWFKAQTSTTPKELITNKTKIASKEKVFAFTDYLEEKLENCGNFKSKEKKPRMVRNLRNIFSRVDLTEQELNTLFGIFNHLTKD